jgi:hypothetical protein
MGNCGIFWIAWMLETMDEAYVKHHSWTRPKLKHDPPSDYFRASSTLTFGEGRAGLALVEEFKLEDNILWANDYLHHEGTWPHSAQAIERQMGRLTETTCAKALDVNAARIFKFDVPESYRD